MNDDNQEDSDKMKTLTAEVRRIRKNVVGMCVCVCRPQAHPHTLYRKDVLEETTESC